MSQSNTPGSGTLEQIEEPHDGWIMRQIKDGKPDPGIKVEHGVNDSLRISHQINKIALAIGEYNLRRFYHQKQDGSFAFFYSIKGSFEHATIDQIKLVKELLLAKFTDDYQSLFFDYDPRMKRLIEAKISLQHSSIYLYSEIVFEKPWEPTEGFQEV